MKQPTKIEPAHGRLGVLRTAAGLAPILVAVTAIAIVGNLSAVRRLAASARIARVPPGPASSRDSAPDVAPISQEAPR